METVKNKEEALKLIEELTKYLETVDSTESLSKERDEWFKSVLLDLKVGRITEKYIEYQNSKGESMIYDMKNGNYAFPYDRIRKFLMEKYLMGDSEIKLYLKTQLLSLLNWNVTSVNTLHADLDFIDNIKNQNV